VKDDMNKKCCLQSQKRIAASMKAEVMGGSRQSEQKISLPHDLAVK